MMKNKKFKRYIVSLSKQIRIKFLLILVYILLFGLLTIPYLFDHVYGDKIVSETLNKVIGNLTNPDEIAVSIMDWEKEYFYNPYSLYNPNSILQKFGIYEINGSYRLFIRNAPVSWIIYSRLANCGEYAKIFVYLMNKQGISARLIRAPGEDHAWAEYYSGGFRITVDPSINDVILDKRKFASGRNWSYIESIDIFNISDKKDVSDEYIKRGILRVFVFDGNQPLENIIVVIKSPYLMKVDPRRYNEPRIVLSSKTDKNGVAVFKLGEKEYIVEVVRRYFIFSLVYSKNVTVTLDKETKVSFNLSKDEKKIRFF